MLYIGMAFADIKQHKPQGWGATTKVKKDAVLVNSILLGGFTFRKYVTYYDTFGRCP